MSSEYLFDDNSKVRSKPDKETAEPQKGNGSITVGEMQNGLDANKVTQMQQTVGNSAVQRFLAQRSGQGAAEIDEETAGAISSQRGQGQGLNEDIATRAGQTMGRDFSDVTVHTDQTSDQLSRQLGAKAFTTGNDIFFREGAYEPSSSDGQRLISHELTHVAQQSGAAPAVQGKMMVNDPDDQYEAEADRVADQVMNQPANVVQQEHIEGDEEPVQMQEIEEKDDEPLS